MARVLQLGRRQSRRRLCLEGVAHPLTWPQQPRRPGQCAGNRVVGHVCGEGRDDRCQPGREGVDDRDVRLLPAGVARHHGKGDHLTGSDGRRRRGQAAAVDVGRGLRQPQHPRDLVRLLQVAGLVLRLAQEDVVARADLVRGGEVPVSLDLRLAGDGMPGAERSGPGPIQPIVLQAHTSLARAIVGDGADQHQHLVAQGVGHHLGHPGAGSLPAGDVGVGRGLVDLEGSRDWLRDVADRVGGPGIEGRAGRIRAEHQRGRVGLPGRAVGAELDAGHAGAQSLGG